MNSLNITFAALFLLLGSTAHGDSVVKNITKEANNFIEQSLFTFLEGNGTTEIQFSGLADKRPEFSIRLLRPIEEYEESVFFSQLQLNHYYVINDERFALNMGLGYRKLLDDNNYFIGANIFFDVDDEEKVVSVALLTEGDDHENSDENVNEVDPTVILSFVVNTNPASAFIVPYSINVNAPAVTSLSLSKSVLLVQPPPLTHK